VQGAGCRVQGSWLMVHGAWFMVHGAGCRVLSCWVQGPGSRVWDSRALGLGVIVQGCMVDASCFMHYGV